MVSWEEAMRVIRFGRMGARVVRGLGWTTAATALAALFVGRWTEAIQIGLVAAACGAALALDDSGRAHREDRPRSGEEREE